MTHEGKSYDFYGLENESYWFPITLRNSVFVTLYGFLEHILIKMCKILKATKKITRSIKSFIDDKNNYGPTIEKASNYILSVVNIHFPNQLPEWTHMKNCAALRNSIIHNFANANDKVNALLPMNGVTTEIKDVANEVLGYDYLGEIVGVSQFNFESSFFLLSGFNKEFLSSFAKIMNDFFMVNGSLLNGKYDKEVADFNFSV
ncbi:hypothetical protein SAMN05428961_110126 [Paenibacillus sp. OK060]|uniref:hypothetical protein n=1 Tax=Paenibacillus sp. OK060 TaxID=1881034 RepID=UPI00088F320A|nr:hypothetical protein [Paenibacillus sp. OK060]SDM16419.1 hypothetical protein SAMN05428961_110126 [Paenibacillus sp. OK060]